MEGFRENFESRDDRIPDNLKRELQDRMREMEKMFLDHHLFLMMNQVNQKMEMEYQEY